MREKLRSEMLKTGNQLRLEMGLRGERRKQEKATLKSQAEELDNAALKVHRDREEEMKKAEVVNNRDEAEETFRKYDSNQNQMLELFELQTRIVFDKNRDGAVTEDEARIPDCSKHRAETMKSRRWLKKRNYNRKGCTIWRVTKPTIKPGKTGSTGMRNISASTPTRRITRLWTSTTEEDEGDDVGEGEIEEAAREAAVKPAVKYDPVTQDLIYKALRSPC
ncbi:uncharacterized protein LOC126560695 [Anopheles maculipalpis]|uniref:uncharacterized protein LOC126560695 n=1 Tax=Anopheles maculipalpis TaxID=1496333 RepID=UPI0021598314|nr:uncharacterized protein LOC126560695 [Anopheles maculipalpis]